MFSSDVSRVARDWQYRVIASLGDQALTDRCKVRDATGPVATPKGRTINACTKPLDPSDR